jgi:hypothetical protein
MSHWAPAVDSLRESSEGIYGPTSFIGYLEEVGERPTEYRTAAELSIDTRRRLNTYLADHDTMVLRVGRASDGRGTQFALVRVPGRLDDFFLDDPTVSGTDREVLDFTPDGADTATLSEATLDTLAVYRSLPTFSETSFVNFALATGVFARALNVDPDRLRTAPTTIASTFDFVFEPHPARPVQLAHNDGQVEIDALVMARRNGERLLFVVEAKSGRRRELAKHKLAYPAFAAAASLGLSVDGIVPVYVHARRTDDTIRYRFAECSDPCATDSVPCLASLEVVDRQQYEVVIDGAGHGQRRLG